MIQRTIGFLMAIVLACTAACANVRLPALFSNGMVLQRGVPVAIWGWADSGEAVTVALGDKKASATADANGRWKVSLPSSEAGGPFELTVAGKSTVALKDVYLGEVWVCSGQSNMENALNGVKNTPEELAAANYPLLRVFRVERSVQDEPLAEVGGRWAVCTPREAQHFSAVAYFFGRDLHKSLNVPVGLITSAWNGTVAEAWMSREALLSDADFRPILDRADAAKIKYAQDIQKLSQKLGGWLSEVEKDRAAGKPGRPMPIVPTVLRAPPDYPDTAVTYMFNGMIAPLIPYSIRGVAWYQGETSVPRAAQYRKLFPALIRDWRTRWGLGDLPFLFVQLPNYGSARDQPAESALAEMREAQAAALALPSTGMIVTADVGDGDLHPLNKQDFGARLAQIARGMVYGQNVAHVFPRYERMEIKGKEITLHFKNAGGKLQTKAGEGVKYVAIAGADRKFIWAQCRIEGETLIVSSNSVNAPEAVRYAWMDNPMGCNLYGSSGLPVSPFRTDTWPGITVDAR